MTDIEQNQVVLALRETAAITNVELKYIREDITEIKGKIQELESRRWPVSTVSVISTILALVAIVAMFAKDFTAVS